MPLTSTGKGIKLHVNATSCTGFKNEEVQFPDNDQAVLLAILFYQHLALSLNMLLILRANGQFTDNDVKWTVHLISLYDADSEKIF